MSLSYTRLVTDDSINPTSINTEDYTLPGSHYSYGNQVLYIESVNEIWIPVSNTEYEPYWEAAPGIYAKFDLNTKIFKSFTTGELATSLESEDYAEGFYDTYNDCIWVYNGIGVIGNTNPKLAKFNSAGVLQFVVDSPTLYYSGDAAYTSYKVFANPNNGKVYSLARYTKVGGISLAVSILEIDVSTGSVSEVLCTINDADSTTYVTLDNLIFDSDNNIWVISNLRDRTTHDITSYSRILWIDVNTGTINTFNSRAVSHSLEYYINAIYNSVDNTILLQKEYYTGANPVIFLKINCATKGWEDNTGVALPLHVYNSFYLNFDPYRNCYWTIIKDYSLTNNFYKSPYYFAKLDATTLAVIEESPKSQKYILPDLSAYIPPDLSAYDYPYAYTSVYEQYLIITNTTIIYPSQIFVYTYHWTEEEKIDIYYQLFNLNSWSINGVSSTCEANLYLISSSDAAIDRVSLVSNTIVQDLDKDKGDFSYDESWSGYMDSISIDNYGYIINEGYAEYGLWLHKIDLKTFTIADQINVLEILSSTYSIAIEYGSNITKSSDEKYLFISGYNSGSIILIKVDVSTFTIINATETSGWGDSFTSYYLRSIFAYSYYSNRLIASLTYSTYPYDSYLVAFSAEDLTQIEAVNYTALGYTNLTSFEYDYIYPLIGCTRISDNKACLLRINEGSIGYIYASTVLDTSTGSAKEVLSIKRLNENTCAVITGSISYSSTYQSTHCPKIYFVELYSSSLTVKQQLDLTDYTDEDFDTKGNIIYLDKMYILGHRTYSFLTDIVAIELGNTEDGTISSYYSYKSSPITTTDKYYSSMLFFNCFNLTKLKKRIIMWVSS